MQRKLILPLAIFWSLSAVAVLAWFMLKNEAVQVVFDSAVVRAEVAASPEVRVQGLSGRSELRDGHGMLFVFDEPGHYPFHMRDMNFVIDIIWINADLEVVDVTHGATPESYPEQFSPPLPVLYVLEVPAEFAASHGIERGSRVTISGLN